MKIPFALVPCIDILLVKYCNIRDSDRYMYLFADYHHEKSSQAKRSKQRY